MVRALLNYIYPYDKGIILDNFAGSGTLLVEATLIGLDSLGVEINPLSALMSNVKCKSFLFNLEELKKEINEYFEKIKKVLPVYNNMVKKQLSLSMAMETKVDFYFIFKKSDNLSSKLKYYLKNKNEVIPQILICKELLKNVQNDDIRDFLLLSLSGAISDITRRTNKEFLKVFEDRVTDLYLRIFLFKKLNEVLKITLGHSTTYVGDARDMKQIIASNQINGIITSPPYSVALDYIKNDFPQLVILELTDSLEKLERNMIGNPKVNYDKKNLLEKIKDAANPLTASETANQIVKYLLSNRKEHEALRNFKFYIDMHESLKEMHRVMKKNSKCCIVIGNNHFVVGNKSIEVPNDKVILELAEKIGFRLDKLIGRELQKSSEGNIREETILILIKEKE
jgi:DNA modification methylase